MTWSTFTWSSGVVDALEITLAENFESTQVERGRLSRLGRFCGDIKLVFAGARGMGCGSAFVKVCELLSLDARV